MTNNLPIGVFDSGVGGLTVAKEIMLRLPKESLLYFGDTARVPYGNKSEETVITYSRQIARFLCSHEVKAIVIACNTASAFALDTLAAEFPVPVIGVVKPGAKAAAAKTAKGRIGVIATSGTIKSGLYERYLASINPELKVFGKACPLFVPLVEEGLTSDSVTKMMAERYLAPLLSEGIDALVLGCTHYPLLTDVIGEVCGPGVALVNPAYETAKELSELLSEKKLLKTDDTPAAHRFFVSDGEEQFRRFADTILPCELEEADVNRMVLS